MSTEGTGSRGQTGHSDSGQKCAVFALTSASGSSCLADPNPQICRHQHGRYKYTCRYCGSDFKDRIQLLHHEKTVRTDNTGHWPVFSEKKGRCKFPGCKHTPKVMCVKCSTYLCFTPSNNCFQLFHQKIGPIYVLVRSLVNKLYYFSNI